MGRGRVQQGSNGVGRVNGGLVFQDAATQDHNNYQPARPVAPAAMERCVHYSSSFTTNSKKSLVRMAVNASRMVGLASPSRKKGATVLKQ